MSENNDENESQVSREIVTFRLSGQDFCIDIINIREIRGWTTPTPLPHTPDYVRGLINLRGAVLPIMDLAKRLGLDTRSASSRDVIIVAMVDGQHVGLVVDGVSDIITVNQADIQPTPTMGGEHSNNYIEGVMSIDDRMIRILDLSRIFPASAGKAA